jgi:predicted dehydrogenase
MKTIRIGIIGTGSRIYSLLKEAFLECEGIEINALCDISDKNMKRY